MYNNLRAREVFLLQEKWKNFVISMQALLLFFFCEIGVCVCVCVTV